VNSGGLTWNRQGGGKTIKIDKADITSVKWMKVPKTNQLEFRTKDGLVYKFVGFREQVIISLSLFPFFIILATSLCDCYKKPHNMFMMIFWKKSLRAMEQLSGSGKKGVVSMRARVYIFIYDFLQKRFGPMYDYSALCLLDIVCMWIHMYKWL
jgi:hypothetical protein